MNEKNDEFWKKLITLVQTSEVIIDRPKNSSHPKYPEFIYPVDYGFLNDTSSMDNDGIDIWVGTDNSHTINGIICTIDLVKRDSEIKILLSCTKKELLDVINIYNRSDNMKGIFIENTIW